MGRPKIIPDRAVYDVALHLLVTEGEKAVTFGAVSRATGLAGATLVQRFASQPSMVQMAVADAWDRLAEAQAQADSTADGSTKGAIAILKALAVAQPAIPALWLAGARDARLRQRAADWRAGVETALAPRLGGGPKGTRAAAMLVAAWLGQMLADDGAEPTFRLKDAAKRLA